jgi:hypothetical protein
VAKQLLDRSDIVAAFEYLWSEKMPEYMAGVNEGKISKSQRRYISPILPPGDTSDESAGNLPSVNRLFDWSISVSFE